MDARPFSKGEQPGRCDTPGVLGSRGMFKTGDTEMAPEKVVNLSWAIFDIYDIEDIDPDPSWPSVDEEGLP